jgi:uncharacterized protein
LESGFERIRKMAKETGNGWNKVFGTAALLLAVLTLFAAATGIWVLTAIPIGFLFGLFMERSDLCGASAFSEVVLMRDNDKVWGIWVAIAVSMLLFALGSAAGLIKLAPKPLMWASYVVGGVIFGVGTVLAGGCISGCLFKAGQGNLNSMAALVAMPFGMASVAYGPLAGFNKMLGSYVINAPDGGPVTLSALTGLPYWLLAILLSGATLAAGIVWTKRSKHTGQGFVIRDDQTSVAKRLFNGRWKPWHSGIAIGMLALMAYMSSAASGRNYPLGVTHGVLFSMTVLTESPIQSVWTNKAPAQKVGPQRAGADAGKTVGTPGPQQPKQPQAAPHNGRIVVWWLVGVVVFVVIGSYVSAKMRGNFHLRPKPPEETMVAFIGGLMVGAGAWLATACVIGHIFSGVALMSVGSILFAIAVILANWATTYAYLMGGFSRQ